MSWDKKRGHGPYFYRAVRLDGKVRKLYVGRGEEAERQARQVEQRQQQLLAQREARQQELARIAAAEDRLRDLLALTDVLVRGVFLAAGFHQHKSQWRRKRHGRDSHNQRGGNDQGRAARGGDPAATDTSEPRAAPTAGQGPAAAEGCRAFWPARPPGPRAWAGGRFAGPLPSGQPGVA